MNAPQDRLVPASEYRSRLIARAALNVSLAPLRQAVRDAPEWRKRLDAIRALYAAYERTGEPWDDIDPYDLGFDSTWTPIERLLWLDLRTMVVLTPTMRFLPQFPVGRYVLDFGDPAHKVGVEADGKDFHDAERDRRRDQALWDRHGWKVYRVTGAEIHRRLMSPYEFIQEFRDAQGEAPDGDLVRASAKAFYSTTSTGICCAIRLLECRGGHAVEWPEILAESLDAHRLASFPVGAW